MNAHIVQTVVAATSYDAGVRAVSALSARMAYVATCLTLCWGVLTATGWVHRLTGRQALRGGHIVLATFTLATGLTHGLAFLLLDSGGLGFLQVVLPFVDGGLARHALGIVGLELMIAVAITAGLHRVLETSQWVNFHRFSYVGVWLVAMHSWLGAAANGSVSTLWLGGITLLAPAITLTVLRFLPPEPLAKIGLVDTPHVVVDNSPAPDEPAPVIDPDNPQSATVRTEVKDKIAVSVDHQRCHHYGICASQAPKVFRLLEDGRLRYAKNPEASQTPLVEAAAHACPMRAIKMSRVVE